MRMLIGERSQYGKRRQNAEIRKALGEGKTVLLVKKSGNEVLKRVDGKTKTIRVKPNAVRNDWDFADRCWAIHDPKWWEGLPPQ